MTVGETLRRARLERKLELSRVADELKISANMLKAIEEERFEKLPGGVFARSFVRQYARLLKLDEDEIVDELKRVLQPSEIADTRRGPHHSLPEISLPRVAEWQAVSDRGIRWSGSVGALALMLLAMLACAGAYAWFQRTRHPAQARAKAPVTSPAPQAAAAPSEQPAAPGNEPAPPGVQPPPPAPAPVVASVPPAPEKTEPAKPSAPGVDTAAASAAPPSPAAPDPNAPIKVEVVAQEPSWISAHADGRNSFTGVLEANQTHLVGASRSVVLKVGNAGGVEVRFNGKPVGLTGGKGAVRTIQFTSGGFQIVEAPNPASPTDSPAPVPPAESPNPF